MTTIAEDKPATGFINDCELVDAVMVMKSGATGATLRSSAALGQNVIWCLVPSTLFLGKT
jgi:hypothetical protein